MENYQVLHLIGEGCFGKVFKGRRKYSGQAVALKFISTRGKSEKDLKNLRQEMAILKTLRHENIILLIDAFETASDFVVVTEFAHGELFEVFQDDRQLPESEVQLIAQQLVKALFYLHSNRVIHRDMKPQNILIGSNNVVKLCDFGFARAMSNKTVVLNSVKGTPLYMAPELVQEQPYNHTADLWSLGVILYELFVGTPPFYTNSLYSLINLIINDTVKYPESMSPIFKSFLQGLLHKNPAKRLGWPELLEHAFVAGPKAPVPSPALSTAPASAVTTPRNSEISRAAVREIQAGFNAKSVYSNEEEIAAECVNSILSPNSGRDLLHVADFLISLFQYQGDQFSSGGSPPVHAIFKHVTERTDECLSALVGLMSEESSSLMRLFGLWLRETPSQPPRNETVVSFFKLAVGTLGSSQQENSVLHCCKCLSVLFTNLSGTVACAELERKHPQILRQLVERLLRLVVKDRDRTARAAVHALSASVVLAAPSSEKDIPSPWSNPAWVMKQESPGTPLQTILSFSDPDRFVECIVDLLTVSGQDKSASTSPRQQQHFMSAPTLDPAAVQLVHVLLFGSWNQVIVRRLNFSTSQEPPPILQAALAASNDTISQCQCLGIVSSILRSASPSQGYRWLTSDYVRSVANWLVTSQATISPWAFSYGLDLVGAMLTLVSAAGDTKRLREAQTMLIALAQSVSVRGFGDYDKNDDRRRIEAKMEGHLMRGPLDGFCSLCSQNGSKRLLRGLLGISGGMRKLISLCGPQGVLSLADCLCSSLTSGSVSSDSLSEVLGVLQSAVLVVQFGLVEKGDGFPRFDALLDTLVHVVTAASQNESVLSGGNFVPGLVNAIYSPFSPPSRSALAVLAVLTQNNSTAVQQLVSAKGLELVKPILVSSSDPDILGESLALVSNVARSGAQFYSAIHEKLNPYREFASLLVMSGVKSKVCSAIGNMARHSAYFYPHLASLVGPLAQACCDQSDSNCRKFASFAIGNLAFHSAALYSDLRPVIPVLIELLGDEDEKTRANAAGALGNFVRNSGALVPAMMASRAVEHLLALVATVPIDSSGRIALFSLGNLATHAGSKELLRSAGQSEILKVLSVARGCKDSQTVKYCERLLTKLNSSTT